MFISSFSFHHSVCDLVRNEDIPLGIRNILLPSSSLNNGSEVMYCSGFQADSCGYFDELTDDEEDDDEDDEEEEEESGKSLDLIHNQ